MASNADQRSTLKEFIASISTIKGDLSNITAPPFLLHTQSTVEFPAYWAEHPSIFVAPASEPDPQKRALLVLRWFLGALKRQQYAGRDEKDGVKKPLNAFLGELFLAQWNDETGETRLVSEQVSHHPPITACYLWNDKHGVRAEGYACQSITFSGTVNIRQIGHAIIHIDKYDEDYLVPLPNVKVSGLLSGTPYPELHGTYEIISSSGLVSVVDFSGKRMLGLSGKKNSIHGGVYRQDDSKRKNPIYEIEGTWNEEFTMQDVANNKSVGTYNTNEQSPTELSVAPRDQQDPWESRRAWAGVIDSLEHGNVQGCSDEKSKVEEAQRAMRKKEEQEGKTWEPKFFIREKSNPVFDKLSKLAPSEQHAEDSEHGFWKINEEQLRTAQKPYHGDLRPDQA